MRGVFLIGLVALSAMPARGVVSEGRARLRLYVDCPTEPCDLDDLKTRLDFVDWVRDRRDADVYVLVTGRTTGSGGSEHTLYVSRAGGSPGPDTLRLFHPVATSVADTRDEMAGAMMAALARDLVFRGEGARLRLDIRDASRDTATATATATRDPWHAWVMRLGLDGTADGQRAYRSSQWNGSLTVSRVTRGSKLGSRFYGGGQGTRYDFSDGSSFSSVTRQWGAGARAVRSVGARWAVGGRAFVSSSSFTNVHLEQGVGPALEFDLFPYDDSSRRLMTLSYEVIGRRVNYMERTLYGKESETLLRHGIGIRLDLAQPWGSVGVGARLGQYLHDGSKYRATVSGSIELGLVRGLSVSVTGYGTRLRDQLELRRGEASNEEVLARLREVETSYEYFASFGLTYTFGSIFDSVVNPRLDYLYGAF